MKKMLLVLGVLLVVGFVVWSQFGRAAGQALNYRLVTVAKGDLEAVVSATGTLDAVTTVPVGTQVSGIINQIYVDFNDRVKAGQVIARLDTTLLANAVAGANAQVARSEAERRLDQSEFTRVAALHQQQMVSDGDYNQAQYNLDAARASLQSAKVDLTRARQNLSYATVTSPIDGTVIARSVDVGQTVQSSFSAPELFLIAGDLTRMQILVAVDESDIGQIHEGQKARFTVQAYPDDSFTGTVRQVRLQATTQENVVNYTAVVDVANPDGRLLPGMTATVDFLVNTATDVLYVANSALRYKPDPAIVAAAMEKMRAARQARQGADAGAVTRQTHRGSTGQSARNRGALWTLDDKGEITMIPVRQGITDGSNTEVKGRNLAEGQQIIVGVSSGAAPTRTASSPFQQAGGRSGGRPRPGGL